MHRFRGQTLRAPKPSSVLITGATGCFAEVINGFFVPVPTDESEGGRVVMMKRSNPTIRLLHVDDCWHIDYDCGCCGEGCRGRTCALVLGPRQLEEFVSQSRVWSVGYLSMSFDPNPEQLQPSVILTILTEAEASQQVSSCCQVANENQPSPKSRFCFF